MSLNTKIENLRYVGPEYVKKLHKVGIDNVRDLLFYLPFRYEDYSEIVKIKNVRPDKKLTVQGKVKSIKNERSKRKNMVLTKALIEDKTAPIESIWFNQPYLKKTLKEGSIVNLSGEVQFNSGKLNFSNPIHEVLKKPDQKKISETYVHTGRIIPIYHETKGLSSRYLRFIISKNIKLAQNTEDFLPQFVKENLELLELKKALREIHYPESKGSAKRAKKRLIFNRILLIQLLLLKKKESLKRKSAYPIEFKKETTQNFVENLPYELTDAQRKSAWEIIQDLQKDYPMRRLLEGEVGSGKTVVALIAALNVAKQNKQIAFMAPTEVLARQHFKETRKPLYKHNVKISLLTGGNQKTYDPQTDTTKEIKREKLLEKIEQGGVDLVIGTHALIQDKVNFSKLALTVVDEQHRFGIKQRAKLLKKAKTAKTTQTKQNTETEIKNKKQKTKNKKSPHLLSMTATPIPRTLSLALYGDLSISQLDQLPEGRKKIKTKLVAPNKKDRAYQFIKKEINKGRQAFVICPLIEKSEKLDSPSAEEEYKKLSEKIYPELNVGLLHGQLPSEEKKEIMQKYKDKKIDILVSTSVIEVGIDIPNASVMVIEGAERFGLSQLHQFRGRVGRAKHQSYCLLFTNSKKQSTRRRLNALVELNDGFALAEKDLEIRGPGDFIGTRQSGRADLTMKALKDIGLIKKARKQAEKILEKSPKLKNYPSLKKKLKQFKTTTHLE